MIKEAQDFMVIIYLDPNVGMIKLSIVPFIDRTQSNNNNETDRPNRQTTSSNSVQIANSIYI